MMMQLLEKVQCREGGIAAMKRSKTNARETV